ncbi:MAG: hypothetical protein PHP00_00560 [Thiotrichaceae bacterium]|nr:hypothetical protein [Thiotrichaceae bacterium]
MKNNRILALAVTTLLAAHHNVSFATITLTAAGSDSALVYAKELPTTTTALKIAAGDQGIVSLLPAGVKVSPTNPVFVKINLSNGAKFGTSTLTGLKFMCKNSADGAGVYSVSASKTVGGAGFINATFQITPVGNTTSATLGSACVLTVSALTISGLTDKSISALVEYSDAGVNKTLASKGKFITFAQGLQVTYTPEASPKKIDVAKSSKQFISGVTNSNTAVVGTVKYAVLANNARNTAGDALTVASALSSVNLIISGPAVGSVHSGTKGISGVFLTTAGDGGCKPNTKYTTTYSGSTITFASVPVAALVGTITACIVGNAAAVIADGQITANMTLKSAANSMAPILTSSRNTLALLKKNGSSTKALVIPPSTSTDKVFVRIYNIGSGTGRVLGTLYSQAGVSLGSGILATTLAPNGVAVLDAAGIQTALGLTAPWTGRAWLQIEAEFQGLRSQVLIRSPSNVLTEFSDGACTSSTMCGDSK